MIALIGSKVGCFGGMGFVAAATDAIVMSEFGRLGLTGPEVIEQEMGKEEFDSADRALVFRTTGGRHKYIMGDCNFLVEDSIATFRSQVAELAPLPVAEFEAMRRIGSEAKGGTAAQGRRPGRRNAAAGCPRRVGQGGQWTTRSR